MTDGILLAEIQRDRDLLRRTTRSSSTRRTSERSTSTSCSATSSSCSPRRPDLKLVITSRDDRPAALRRSTSAARRCVEVSGRTLPGRGALPAAGRRTERRRRPGAGDRATRSTSCPAEGPGDVLVFLSGEREIRDTADALRGLACRERHRGRCRCTPGCRRPSSTGSSRRTRGRRIVLATNVAETSLTVPGIRYVVDPGTARISRYSQRTKVQRLPIERDQPGVGEPARRPLRPRRRRHLHPALRGGGLPRPAGVHRPGDPAHQPGVGHPADDGARPRRHRGLPVRRAAGPAQRQGRRRPAASSSARSTPAQDDPRKRLTQLGRTLAQLPVDPRLAPHGARGRPQRLRARGARHRRRAVDPGPARAAGRTSSRRPTSCTRASPTSTRTSWPTSTCGATCRSSRRRCPSSAFRRLCKKEFLQLPARARVAGPAQPAAPRRCRRLRPAGSSSAPDERRRRPPVAARRPAVATSACATSRSASTSARAAPASRSCPASALAKKAPQWVMAAELVETNRMWGRVAARIDPEWVERAGRPPGEAQLQRAALGAQARRGRWRTSG